MRISTDALSPQLQTAPTTVWPAVVVAYIAGIYAAACVARVGPLVGSIREELGLSLVSAAWYASLANILTGCAALLVGIMAPRIGYWRLSAFGVASLALGSAAGAAADGEVALFLARFLEALGYVAVVVTVPGFIAQATAVADRPRALAYWGLHITMGPALGLAAAGSSATPDGSWRALWFDFAVIGLLLFVALFVFAHRVAGRERQPDPIRRATTSVRGTLGRAGPWLLGAALITQGLQLSTLMVWFPTYLFESLELSRQAAAFVTAGLFLFACCGSIYGGRITRVNQGRGAILVWTFPTAGLLFIAMLTDGLADSVRLSIGMVGGFVLGITATVATSGSARYARSPSEMGVLQGVLSQGAQLGVFLGPPVAAMVVTLAGGWSTLRWLIAAYAGAGLLLSLAIRKDDRATDQLDVNRERPETASATTPRG